MIFIKIYLYSFTVIYDLSAVFFPKFKSGTTKFNPITKISGEEEPNTYNDVFTKVTVVKIEIFLMSAT